MKNAALILGVWALVAFSHLPAVEALGAAPAWPRADPAAIARWQDMRFGMFIHWGPVSLTGREIGWSRGGNQTPIEVYDTLYERFNPTNYNADEWVSVAKDAGMKYIVLTGLRCHFWGGSPSVDARSCGPWKETHLSGIAHGQRLPAPGRVSFLMGSTGGIPRRCRVASRSGKTEAPRTREAPCTRFGRDRKRALLLPVAVPN